MKKHFLCTLTGMGILLVSLCLFTGSPLFVAVATAAEIRGQVIYDDSPSVAVQIAKVSVCDSNGEPMFSAETDSSGHFSLALQSDMQGLWTIFAQPPASYESKYENSQALKMEITDTATSRELPEPLVLPRLGTIAGQVVRVASDNTKVPAAYAAVFAQTQDYAYSKETVSDTDGNFTLNVPAKKLWVIHAEPPPTSDYRQYAFSERISVLIANPAVPHRLTEPLNLRAINVKNISGTVRYKGNPVAGVEVTAADWDNPDTYKSPVTSADGKFDLWVSGGLYELRVRQLQGVEWIAPIPKEVGFSEDTVPETKISDIDLESGEAILKGRILDPDGNALTSIPSPNPAVEIELVGAENRFSRCVNPDGQGNFSFPLPAGLYEVSVWSDPKAYPDDDAPSSQTFRITRNEQKIVDFRLEKRSAVLRGSVISSDTGKGIPRIHVVAWESEDEDDWYEAETDVFGNYSFKLSAGEWTVEPLISGRFNDIFWEIELEDGDNETLELFKINEGRTISGAVTDENGNVLEDVEAVVYARLDGNDPSPAADAHVVKGRFSLTVPDEKLYIGLILPPGNKYCFAGDKEILHSKRNEIISKADGKMTTALSAVADLYPYEQMIGPASSSRSLLKRNRNAREDTGYDITFNLKENKTFIQGKILDSGGKAVTGVKGHVVATSADDPGLWQSADINPENGAFSIPAGKGLWHVSYGLETRAYLPYPLRPLDVEIASEGSVAKDMTLIPLTRKIQGTVQDENGNPMSNIEVWGKSNLMTENFFEISVFSGADGTFEIAMPPQDAVQKDKITRGSAEYNECISTAINMCGGDVYCYREAKTECKDEYLRSSALKENTELVLKLRKAEAFLEGKVLDEKGNAVKGALVSAYSGDGQKAHGNTDNDGKYQLKVAKTDSLEGKTWEVGATYKPVGSSTCYQSEDQKVVMETNQTSVPDLKLEVWATLPQSQSYEFQVEKGWSYTLSDGFQIRIPGNAIKTREKNVKIMIEPAIAGLPDNDEEDNLRYGYKISVYERESGKRILEKFNKKIMFCFRFSKAWIEKLGVRASDIRPAYFSEMSNSWQPIKSFTTELKDGVYSIFFQTDHLSSWALAASRSGAVVRLGDINGDGGIGLEDAILALQICSEFPSAADVEINAEADADGDKKIGLAEAIYILKTFAQ